MITLSQNLVQNVAGDPVADVCLGHDTRFQVHGDKLTELLDDPVFSAKAYHIELK